MIQSFADNLKSLVQQTFVSEELLKLYMMFQLLYSFEKMNQDASFQIYDEDMMWQKLY
jgi:hypothetical protein